MALSCDSSSWKSFFLLPKNKYWKTWISFFYNVKLLKTFFFSLFQIKIKSINSGWGWVSWMCLFRDYFMTSKCVVSSKELWMKWNLELEKVLRFEEISSFFFEWEKSADCLLVLAFHGIIFTQWAYYFIAFLMKFQFPFSRFRKKFFSPASICHNNQKIVE